jgi:nicotinate-nucleotide--dimethylbenzimidazole phosphoribosyltransferase
MKHMDFNLPQPDQDAMAAVKSRAGQVLRPLGALGRLDEIAAWLAGWQRTTSPDVDPVHCIVFASDHGIAAAGVSAYPSEVTESMLGAFRAGVATANAMCNTLGVRLGVVDVGVGRPTGNITMEPAMDQERFDEAWMAGRSAVSALETPGLLVLGEMGIGNTTAAAVVCTSVFGGEAELWTGRGTGIDDRSLERKMAAVEAAARRIQGLSPLEVLREGGGAELVSIAGAVVEARLRSIPVVLDGFVVGAACVAIEAARPGILQHTIAGHCSAEPGHRLLLEKLGMEPILDLGLRLGEGSGALAAVPLIQLAAHAVTDVATFEEWGLGR